MTNAFLEYILHLLMHDITASLLVATLIEVVHIKLMILII